MTEPVYLDNAATTRPREEVLRALWPYLTDEFGNVSSVHERGHSAAEALERAQNVIAELTGFAATDVVFTSGGTEANNLAVTGLALGQLRGRHIVSAQTEHSSVLESIYWLERTHGFEVTWVPVSPDGSIQEDDLRAALRQDTTLVTLMHANNEIGTVHDVARFAAIAHEHGALFHTDAVQSAGWLPLSGLGVDALTLSGHKIGAPQGVGAALIRSGLLLEPTVWGGGQQNGRRSGTVNLPGAVALATALAFEERDRLDGVPDRIAHLRDILTEGVATIAPGSSLTGSATSRVPHIASFVFPGVNGETLLIDLERHGVVCSSGSACAAGSTDPSHVLIALGLDEQTSRTSVRLSLSRTTTTEEIEHALRALKASLPKSG